MHVGFIQNCRKDKEIQPRHQTVFIDMLNDSSLIIPFPFVFSRSKNVEVVFMSLCKQEILA